MFCCKVWQYHLDISASISAVVSVKKEGRLLGKKVSLEITWLKNWWIKMCFVAPREKSREYHLYQVYILFSTVIISLISFSSRGVYFTQVCEYVNGRVIIDSLYSFCVLSPIVFQLAWNSYALFSLKYCSWGWLLLFFPPLIKSSHLFYPMTTSQSVFLCSPLGHFNPTLSMYVVWWPYKTTVILPE